jgi:ribosomal peptide maturation radical SAM protein 1
MGTDVLLVVMPNHDLRRPSLAMGLLKSALHGSGIRSSVAYWNLAFAERIGFDRYQSLTSDDHRQADWVFSHSLFGHTREVSDEYLRARSLTRDPVPADRLEHYRYARDRATSFLEDRVRNVDWGQYDVVGLTTTFQENTATLALAWRIKEVAPKVKIVFGGANCRGEMGVQFLKLFPFVDYVCLGEGDRAFPALLQALREGDEQTTLPPGIVGRVNGKLNDDSPPAELAQVDDLPFPDFDDYFDALESSRLRDVIRPSLLLETSRGCWWGEKNHCKFCGLNAHDMAYRSKSPERALREIRALSTRYAPRMGEAPTIAFADNILDMGYFDTVLPALRESPFRYSYEVKANLKKEQVERLADVGVMTVQAGIESLSTPVLRLMRKGCNRLQNVQILKWCDQFGIFVYWNLLTGFPEEDPGEYASQCELIQDILHLPPPDAVSRFVLARFSPYFREPGEYGIANVRPQGIYHYIYPFPEEDLEPLAHEFCFEFSNGYDPDAHAAGLNEITKHWKSDERHDYLYATDVNGTLVLWDGRSGRASKTYVLAGIRRLIYLHCDEIRGICSIEEALQDAGAPPGKAQDILDEFVRQRLMICENGQYLSLAVLLIQQEKLAGGQAARVPGSEGSPDVAMDATFRPAPHVSVRELDEHTLILDAPKRQLHVLNEFASAVWELCIEGTPVAEVVKTLSTVLSWDPGTVQTDTLVAIRDFVDRHLLVAD